jgi:hypothetical protein
MDIVAQVMRYKMRNSAALGRLILSVNPLDLSFAFAKC